MVGRLNLLTNVDPPEPINPNSGRRIVPRGGEFIVRDFFCDLQYHDLGEEFHQVQFDGTVIRQFRTPPLWGVGSNAPYGHDGANLDLDSVIQRHAGEAVATRDAYRALTEVEQEATQAFLRGLVLYQTDQLPCDIDGDGKISEEFIVSGQCVGLETFRPEWLLNTPCRRSQPRRLARQGI